MDWIKVKIKHILFEYSDLSDSEFRSWIKAMALTATLGHIPTDKQLLGIMHHKSLRSLQGTFKEPSRNLQGVLKKVLEDVDKVESRKEYDKNYKKDKRKSQGNENSFLKGEDVHVDINVDVPVDVHVDVHKDINVDVPIDVHSDVGVQRREDKIRDMLSYRSAKNKKPDKNDDNIPSELKDLIPEEVKGELSSLFFVKSFFDEIGLTKDFKVNGEAIDFESSGVLEIIASLYTKSQNKAKDSDKYARSVKRGLMGTSDKEWDISEVLVDSWKYAEKRIRYITSKYQDKKNKNDNQAEIDTYNQKRRMAKDMLIEYSEIDTEALILEAIKNINPDDLGGLRANQNHPIVREEMYRLILLKAGIK